MKKSGRILIWHSLGSHSPLPDRGGARSGGVHLPLNTAVLGVKQLLKGPITQPSSFGPIL